MKRRFFLIPLTCLFAVFIACGKQENKNPGPYYSYKTEKDGTAHVLVGGDDKDDYYVVVPSDIAS